MALRDLRGVLVPVALLILWELASRTGLVSAVVLPPPSAVAVKWWSGLLPALPYDPGQESYLSWLFSGEMPHDAASSLSRVVSGFLIGAGLAVPVGLVLGTNDGLYALFNPLLQVLRPIPPIAYIPLAIVWFGLGNPPALFLIALGTFFPVLVNTIAGVRQVDSIYIRAARNLGAGSWTMFRRVILPAASPFVLAGMRIGIGTAFIVVIVAEMIAVSDGLGYRILEAREYMWSDKIIGGMLTIGILGLIIDGAMSRLNDHLLRWHRGLER
ncbi:MULTISPECIES: ABC transporter permease [unclassified Methylobacterium]|uniref:ABC transporter permease n=1 Tax=unclassified Methylobacterium TaxID=2615210 RepID=UPI0011C1F118|nr:MULTISPECIES: ABC transporter permease [unclassified Methylobacterium]QEE38471.1 ABC transporter permease [Methylobacterium sp. WL1]TXN03470.1 ABC transporter permease [Methylobacterium sp. WL64]TXN56546.1 ABC transporter permease [Methylobacterium sp. WL2]